MQKLATPIEDYTKIREDLINKLFRVLPIVAFVLAFSSLLRLNSGFHYSFITDFLFVGGLLYLGLFRRRIKYSTKVRALLLIIFVSTLIEAFTWSVSGVVILVLASFVFSAMVFDSHRNSYISLFVAVLTLIVIGVLHINDIIRPELFLPKSGNELILWWIYTITSFAVIVFAFVYVLGETFFYLINEIDKRNIIEQDLIKEKEKAENANRFKSEFLAQMSHEIRTPINTLLNYNSLIKDEVKNKVPDDVNEYFTRMDIAGNRIVRTVNLILDMSEIQTNTLKLEKREINLCDEILNNLYKEFHPMAKLKGINLTIEKPNDPLILVADEYTLTQIFHNLIDNAIKYTHSGAVIIRANEIEDLVTVEIEDSGIGIDEIYIDKIFDTFSQEEQGYSRKFEGNGLGLALVKHYCNSNNAKIEVESKKGAGSTFRITFLNSSN